MESVVECVSKFGVSSNQIRSQIKLDVGTLLWALNNIITCTNNIF